MNDLSKNARELLKTRYCYPDEEPKDVFKRVSDRIGNVRNKQNEYYLVMKNLDFIPNTPTLVNASFSDECSACYVIPIKDSIDSIFKAIADMAKIQSSGGGTGFSFSKLREKGAPISGGGASTGALSFMRIFDQTTNSIRQGGIRRGASIGILDYDHPEIIDFVKEKITNGTMKNFNLSVMATNDFMKKVENDERCILRSRYDGSIYTKLRARDIFKMICYSSWLSADPGMLFKDTINRNSDWDEEIVATNPCSELPLPDYGHCTLGSINLSNFVKDGDIEESRLEEVIRIGTNFLLDINEIQEFPLEENYEICKKYNPIGLGVMGFADMLMDMNIKYDSRDTYKVIHKIGRMMDRITKEEAPDSANRTTVAPTGSCSIIADCSSGIEPIYSKEYIRDTRSGEYFESRDDEYLRTAHQIDPMWHLRIQGKWQEHITGGISKTINMPNNASVEQVEKIYMEAWKRNLKGITIYRDKSKDRQVYNSCSDEECYL